MRTIAVTDVQPCPPEKPTVTVSATDAQAAEQGPDTGTFTISRAGDTSSDLSENGTPHGSAQDTGDYRMLGTSVTIAAGASSTTVTVRPIDDGEIEGDESVTLTISESVFFFNDTATTEIYTLSLHDALPISPEKPTVTVSATDAQAAEQGTDTGTFTISRAGDTSSDLS